MPVLHPAQRLLRRAAKVHGIGCIGAHHHHPFKNSAPENVIGLPEGRMEREKFVLGGGHAAGGEQKGRLAALVEAVGKGFLRDAQGFEDSGVRVPTA